MFATIVICPCYSGCPSQTTEATNNALIVSTSTGTRTATDPSASDQNTTGYASSTSEFTTAISTPSVQQTTVTTKRSTTSVGFSSTQGMPKPTQSSYESSDTSLIVGGVIGVLVITTIVAGIVIYKYIIQ